MVIISRDSAVNKQRTHFQHELKWRNGHYY
uniref:Uncharacterized protein n=1 Tax=Anguilla anguilla TaxID=7936 RepID=A0A0E9T642_ANGAN